MNLIIDAGNTQIKWAVYSDNSQVFKKTCDNWNSFLQDDCFSQYPDITSAIISSVRLVPDEILNHLRSNVSSFCELSYRLPLPVKLKYKTPATLGKDRIAAAVGASSIYPSNTILIIDLGTAITFDLINVKQEFIGGNISPGMQLRFKALSNFTQDLPEVKPTENIPLLGQTTEEAIRSGVQSGILYEIDAYINTLINKYNGLITILTGGDASFFVKNLKNTIFVVPDLVLNGLNLILIHQNEKKQG